MRQFRIPAIILAILSTSCGRVAGSLSADSPEYDFGVLDDTVTVVTHTFLLKNNGRDTCHISRVNKSCGCTSLDVSSYDIAPGETATLSTSVNIRGFYDHIEKTVTVYCRGGDKPLTLKLLADMPRKAEVPQVEYPYNAGGPARFQVHILFGGYVRQGDKKDASIVVFNDSDRPLRLRRASGLPRHVRLTLPGKVQPHSIGRVTATFDFRSVRNIFGEFSHEIKLSDGRGHRIPLQLLAIVTEAPSPDASPSLSAPVIVYRILDSEKDEGEATKNFRLINEGEADLLIRNVSAPEGVEAVVSSDVIPPGSEGILSVTVSGEALSRETEVTVTTNASVRPFRSFRILPPEG